MTNIVVDAAMGQIGKPYEFDRPIDPKDPNPKSFDCSGLTMWCWGKAGINLPHNAAAQFGFVIHRPLSQVQLGDILFYADPTTQHIYHCTIFAGDGQMIEAPHTGAFVEKRSIWGTPLSSVGAYLATPKPPPAPKTYVVRPGDTLTRIAANFNTSIAHLVEWNYRTYPSLATNRNLIDVGWTLVVGK